VTGSTFLQNIGKHLTNIIHNTERGEYECEQPQPVKDWPHPAMRPTCMEPQDSTQYSKVIFTDGSKTDDKVGAGVAIYRYVDQDLIKRSKYKLGSCCTNNQVEEFALLKSLEEISLLPDHKDRMVAIYTDSQVTLDSLRNNFIHTPIIRYKETGTKANSTKLDNPLRLGKVAHRNRG
jgi:ribonuclease HI